MEENNIWKPRNSYNMEDSSVPLRKDEDLAKPSGVTVDMDKDERKEEKIQPGFKKKGLVYGVDDRPPLNIALVCAFQVSKDILS